MGIGTRRGPPLPAPTDISSADNTSGITDDVATDISRRTDRTSYSVPEDGRPVTISTKKLRGDDPSGSGQQASQTSLLIEYFEGGRASDKTQSRPSVRVRVTPSSSKGHKERAGEHVQITETSKFRKPAYTRRISLGKSAAEGAIAGAAIGASTDTYFDESGLGGSRPPVEVEVLHGDKSDLSQSDISRGRFVPLASDVSSMPPESMLDTPVIETPQRRRSRSLERSEKTVIKDTLKTPQRRRSRSLSRERITQKVMEKLTGEKVVSPTGGSHGKHRSSKGRDRSYSKNSHEGSRTPRRRSSASHRDEEAVFSGTDSALDSQLGPQGSVKSGNSIASSINNPKLLQTVEDAIRRLILPELNALKEETRVQSNKSKFEQLKDNVTGSSSRDDPKRRVSKSSSAPDVAGRRKPKVVLNRDEDDPGITLSHGDSVKVRKSRRSSRESGTDKSYSRHGSFSTHDEEHRDRIRKKKSRDRSHSHRSRDALAAGALGVGLTAAALRHHDQQSNPDSPKRERRKRRSKSKTRETSGQESVDTPSVKKSDIPPLPMQSELHSDLTRDSIMSVDTEKHGSERSRGYVTPPVKDVTRGSPREIMSPTPASPSSRTVTRTPNTAQRGLETSYSNKSQANVSVHSAKSDRSGTRSRTAAIAAGAAAAVLAGKAASPRAKDHSVSPGAKGSPVQSEASYSATREAALKKSIATQSPIYDGPSRMSYSTASAPESPKYNRGDRPQGISLESPSEILGRETEEDGPEPEDVDEWLDREHERNEQYRSEIGTNDPRDSSSDYKRMTDYTDDMDAPYFHRLRADQQIRGVGLAPEYVGTPLAVESAVASLHGDNSNPSQRSSQSGNPQPVLDRSQASSASAQHRHLPNQLEGDTLVPGEEGSVKDQWIAFQNHAQRQEEERLHKKHLAAVAVAEAAGTQSPTQSEARSETHSIPKMSASAVPLHPDEMPGVHGLYPHDDESVTTTNPPSIQGPFDYQGVRHEDLQSYSQASYSQDSLNEGGRDEYAPSGDGGFSAADAGMAGIGAAVATGAIVGAGQKSRGTGIAWEDQRRDLKPTVEDVYPEQDAFLSKGAMAPSPAHGKDEGYMSSAAVRSPGGYTHDSLQEVPKLFDERDLENFNIAPGTGPAPMARMPGSFEDMDDPFNTGKLARHHSVNSHGMASPLYDNATGKGIDRIQSKDVVALMDHLTVRDAQRNARDTEILITLVRSAAEMRNSFEEMKQFISEQDKLTMSHHDRNAEITVQRVLQGPRPQPLGSPRVPRHIQEQQRLERQRSSDEGTAAYGSPEDLPAKRRNVFRRALKGLSLRSSNDLGKIEDMLMQLLGEVEGLKDAQGITHSGNFASNANMTSNAPGSYDNLRSAPGTAVGNGPTDPGYEPEGQAGTSSSTPNQSGPSLSNPSVNRYTAGRHSGYDGRRASDNRISTVIEGDEDLAEHDEERMLTPTQESTRYRGDVFTVPPPDISTTPPAADKHLARYSTAAAAISSYENTPRTNSSEKNRKSSKYKSNTSSIFGGIPKISRWSRTTASSAEPASARNSFAGQRTTGNDAGYRERGDSEASKSGSQVDIVGERSPRDGDYYPEEGQPYTVRDEDRLRSAGSLAAEQAASGSRASSAQRQRSFEQQLRPASPLIPSEAGSASNAPYVQDPAHYQYDNDYLQDDWTDDPKYQAHRNSLNLQHPQPRAGQTGRHQNQLESQARAWREMQDEDGGSVRSSSLTGGADQQPAYEQWGSNPSLALNRNRLSAGSAGSGGKRDDGPLVPENGNLNGGLVGSRQAYGSTGSPAMATGHLGPLAPIEEVRYSLETDRQHLSPSPSVQPSAAISSPAGRQTSGHRKITGPRPMGTRNSSARSANTVDSSGQGRPSPPAQQPQQLMGTTRRKPVAARSWESYNSFESETF